MHPPCVCRYASCPSTDIQRCNWVQRLTLEQKWLKKKGHNYLTDERYKNGLSHSSLTCNRKPLHVVLITWMCACNDNEHSYFFDSILHRPKTCILFMLCTITYLCFRQVVKYFHCFHCGAMANMHRVSHAATRGEAKWGSMLNSQRCIIHRGYMDLSTPDRVAKPCVMSSLCPVIYTQRGRSRAEHVRHREADVESANNWRLVHLRHFKGEGRAHIWVVFSCKGGQRGEWRGRRAEPTNPFLVASDQKRQIIANVVSP